jgi:hypothetical protein
MIYNKTELLEELNNTKSFWLFQLMIPRLAKGDLISGADKVSLPGRELNGEIRQPLPV